MLEKITRLSEKAVLLGGLLFVVGYIGILTTGPIGLKSTIQFQDTPAQVFSGKLLMTGLAVAGVSILIHIICLALEMDRECRGEGSKGEGK